MTALRKDLKSLPTCRPIYGRGKVVSQLREMRSEMATKPWVEMNSDPNGSLFLCLH